MTDLQRPVVVFAATSVERWLFPVTPGIEVMQTGIGPALSADAFRRALRRGLRGVISFGFAGALQPDLPCGSLLLPRAVRMSDGRCMGVDQGWHRQILTALSRSGCSPDLRDIVQVESVLEGEQAKAQVARQSQAAAADMESGALAEQAIANRVPFVALRVVLDELSDTVPAPLGRAVSADGSLAPAQLLAGLLRHPWAVRHLARLALRRNVAARSLTHAARLAGPTLLQGSPSHGSE